jgi:non-ribosomal peptide synthetase component F
MVAGLLGVLKAGGAYVPLDPSYPAQRLAYMAQDSQPRAVLTQAALLGQVREMLGHQDAQLPMLALDEPGAFDDQPTHNPNPQALGLTARNLAYVIYTSGSTGQPKGVAIEHRNTVNFIEWARRAPVSEGLDVTLLSTSINFDLAVY